MTKTFKGFPLDDNGNVLGAFPSIEIHQETKNVLEQVQENMNRFMFDCVMKLNIDPDVLMKQKAQIELLQMQIERLKEENARLNEQVNTYLEMLVNETKKRIPDSKGYTVWAKTLIERFLDFESFAQERGCFIADDTRKQAEAFLEE